MKNKIIAALSQGAKEYYNVSNHNLRDVETLKARGAILWAGTEMGLRPKEIHEFMNMDQGNASRLRKKYIAETPPEEKEGVWIIIKLYLQATVFCNDFSPLEY